MTDHVSRHTTIQQLESEFQAARGDYYRLKQIADTLQNYRTPQASRLRFKVIAEMVKVRGQANSSRSSRPVQPPQRPALSAHGPTPRAPLSSPLSRILRRFGLMVPDGRPLYRYRLGAEGYEELTNLLLERAKQLQKNNGTHAALIVLWASAWFRRAYEGGTRRYQDLNAAIGATLEERDWPELIKQGLDWWKRPVIRRSGTRQWLLTVAVEGGFPIRVLQSGEGWLSRYLNEVVGRLLSLSEEPSADDAFAIAEGSEGKLREAYRQEAFIALAADLALAIVKLRRRAEKEAPNLPPSAVLDHIHPTWRDELPIATDTNVARQLVDGMLATKKIARGLTGGAGCVRLLRRHKEGWRTGVRLSLEGEIEAADLADLAVSGTRLDIYPYGDLARALSEEMAFLEPPGEGGTSWRLRALTGRTELYNVPLDAPIQVLIQSPDGASRVFPWPNGRGELGDVITFEIDAEDEEGPLVLVLAARGSASLRAERVVVCTPAGWRVGWEDKTVDGAPQCIGTTHDGRALWLVEKSVAIASADGAFFYRIRVGADEEVREQIVLHGPTPQGFVSADDLPLFSGEPAVLCRNGWTEIKPAHNELVWRHSPTERWRDITCARLPSGVVDIMWQDVRSRFIRDRIRIGIVPPSARVIRDRTHNGWRYHFDGFGHLMISVEHAPGLYVEEPEENVFVLSFRQHPSRRVTFCLKDPRNPRPIRISLPFPLEDGLAHWNGKIVPPGVEITPVELSELVAFGEGRIMLFYDLRHPDIRIPTQTIIGDRELSLRSLADRVRSDLASAGIDTFATLRTTGNGPWRIRLFDAEVRPSYPAVTVSRLGREAGPLTLVGRSVANPHEELVIAEINRENALNRVPIMLPEHMTGTWWVYLRSGRTVRSRPSLVNCKGASPSVGKGLSETLVIADPCTRHYAVIKRLQELAENVESATEEIDWLNRLIGSLEGLPASTFDVLTALPQSPVVLARLLLSATDATQGAVWRLETELPFMWAALPLKVWNEAVEAIGKSIFQPLIKHGWSTEEAVPLAKQVIEGAISRVASLDPLMSVVLAAAGLHTRPEAVPSIREAAEGYVRRMAERGIEKQTSMFRRPGLEQLLPKFFTTVFDPMHLEALDAPIAAAVAAKHEITLNHQELMRCREAISVDRAYFEDAVKAVLFGTGH